MSASTSLHSAHLAEMVEISTFDYGFKVTTSSTEMAEIAEIDPLQLTEQGAAGDAATTITIMAGAVLPMQANSATRDEGPCWYDDEAALERHQANAGAIDVDIHQQVLHESALVRLRLPRGEVLGLGPRDVELLADLGERIRGPVNGSRPARPDLHPPASCCLRCDWKSFRLMLQV